MLPGTSIPKFYKQKRQKQLPNISLINDTKQPEKF